MNKVLTGVNYRHKRFGLQRMIISKYHVFEAVIKNYRLLIHTLGYNCSLLSDSEILGLGDAIMEYEDGDKTLLIEILNFLS
jgi:hypothetical protein